MKKEEIDDRLMDALLRGESEEDFVGGVAEAKATRVKKANAFKAVLAVAAMVLFAAIAVFYQRKQESTEQKTLVAKQADEAQMIRDAEAELAALDAAIQEQEDKVEEKRKVLDTIVRITGRPYFEGSRNSPESTERTLTMMAEKNAFEMRKNRDQYEIYLDKLETLDSEKLLRYAAELPVDNNSVSQAHVEYLAQNRQLDVLKSSGLSERHPEIVAHREQLKELKNDLDTKVDTLRETLATNHELVSERLEVMESKRKDEAVELVQLATEMHDYKEASREYENSLALLQELKIKHSGEGKFLKGISKREGVKQGSSVSEKAEQEIPSGESKAGDAVGGQELASLETPKESVIPPPLLLPASINSFNDSADFGAGWGYGGGGAGSENSSQRRSLSKHRRFQPANSTEKYSPLKDQPWKSPRKEALSTFSVDVDTASYTNIRRLLNSGSSIPKDAVRIEELVNYFDYNYPQPANGEAFGVGLEMATCSWEPKHNLVRVALQGKEIKHEERGEANLVFLIDVSGSMQDSDKLPLLVESLGLMVEELREKDSVAIVVYAGREGLVLEPTEMGQGGRENVAEALQKLSAGGSTNGGAGIKLAYRLARENFVSGGINRVILATDGDFNVGVTGRDDLVSLVKKEAEGGVFLSVCGFGRGNLNDSMLEAITNDGNGVYYYVDCREEGRRVFLEKLMGTLVTIAKDVKIQVEFNPAKVGRYRLIGYANRVLKKEDFNNDKVDAGDIGSGHQVTAFYEIVPNGVTGTVRPEVDALKYQTGEETEPANNSADWMTVKLRHKEPEGEVSKLQEFVLKGETKPWQKMDADFQFASGVALWGMSIREERGPQVGARLALTMLTRSLNEDAQRIELKELIERNLREAD